MLQQSAPISPHPYQDSLNTGLSPPKLTPDTVRYWSDYSRVFYHPRSIVQINDYELASSIQPFERWESGEELYDTLDKEEGILDRDVRRWVEECDLLQGVQIVMGADDAWGGFGSRMVAGLRDEMDKGAIWAWIIEEEAGTGSRDKQLLRTVNTAKTVCELFPQTSMCVPLSIPYTPLPHYIHLDRSSQWHTSALLSAAWESVTLPSRLRLNNTKRGLLDDMVAALNVNGRQRMASLQCSLLDPDQVNGSDAVLSRASNDQRMPGSNTSSKVLSQHDAQEANASFDVDLSGGETSSSALDATRSKVEDHIFGRDEVIRDRTAGQNDEGNNRQDEIMARKRRRLAGAPVVERYRSRLQYPLLDSFPSIFAHPFLDGNTIAVHVSLSTTTETSHKVQALQRVVRRTAGLEDREALCSGLGDISEAYEGGWEHYGSDDDSDD